MSDVSQNFVGWKVILISGLIVIFTVIYVYFKYVLYAYWKKRGVFYVEPTVPFGNIFATVAMEKYLGDLCAEEYFKHKEKGIFGVYAFHKPCLVIADPNLIQHVLTKDFSSFHDRGIYYNEEVDPLSVILSFVPGAKWRYLRTKLSPAFTVGKMKRLLDLLLRHENKLTQFFEKNIGKELDLRDVYARFTTDINVAVSLGKECNSLEDPNNKFRVWGKRILASRPILNAFALLAPSVLYALRIPFTPKDAREFFLRTFEETVMYRKENNIVGMDFMDLFIQLLNTGKIEREDTDERDFKDSGTKLTMIEAAAQAYNFFIAGFESSSILTTYCIYEMTLNEEIQSKCRADIKAAIEKNGGQITYDAVNEMKYLHKVVQEGMRKYPALGGFNRVCTKDTVLPTGQRIEKGVDVAIPVLGLHRDPEIYPNPEHFDPERFTAENIAKRHPYTYLPFGQGPRNCIGLRYGLLQVKIGIISALMNFQFVVTSRTPRFLKIDPGALAVVPDCPVLVRVLPLQ